MRSENRPAGKAALWRPDFTLSSDFDLPIAVTLTAKAKKLRAAPNTPNLPANNCRGEPNEFALAELFTPDFVGRKMPW
jgi:hypothetical protein